ncbi:MAG TPA: histidine kinase dimerization/phospho-acceptor domain-containing protein [Labilithrix sp.]|jgi:signal transduction histidine kinase|nr:histidine kinase dimerization/phospho-acceptor domain-containing protein [Labilithrix sp.]
MTAEAPESPDLAGLLSRLDQLRHIERRAASARMVAMIGHLIGTPLNVIAGRAGLIRTNPTPEGIDENVRRIEEQVERLSQRIRRLIDYFAMSGPESPSRSVDDLLAECLAIYRPIAERKGVRIEASNSVDGSHKIDGSLGPLVLTTLFSLAVRSSQSGQLVDVKVLEQETKTVVFELFLPALTAPPGPLDRPDPPEYGVQYDVGVLETLWICTALTRRIGGGIELSTPSDSGVGLTVRVSFARS